MATLSRLFDTGQDSGAIFSECRTWRYTLWRRWDPEKPTIAFIGLNPSTATETVDDPTIRRCIDFSRRWGFGRYVMLNLFGFRSTDPKGLRMTDDPVGPENDAHIKQVASEVHRVCVAWGAHSHPLIKSRVETVAAMLDQPYCLGVTKRGSPKHPLYVLGATQPVLWNKKGVQ